MNKKNAIRIVTKSAKLYHDNLENQSICFIYGEPSVINSQMEMEEKILKGLSFYEACFLRSNFLHLTGVKLSKNGNVKSSIDFYKRCLSNRISEKDFEMSEDGSTSQKLMVLEQMMNIKKNVQMIGDFSDFGIKLYSEKVAGNICACIGFVTDANTGLNVPNTLLNKDIREVSPKPQQKVYMVLSKNYGDVSYAKLEKCDKKIKEGKFELPTQITSLMTNTVLE